ncbi:MAG TPA: YibE/F family protein [Conexibacter sp.]|nr:YibE/F family protein [Conexibacter sp.]
MSDELPRGAAPPRDDNGADYIEAWADERDAGARARAERRAARAARRRPARAARGGTVVPRLARLRAHAGGGLLGSRWGRGLAAAAGVLAFATLIGLVALWPHGTTHRAAPGQAMGGATLPARVRAVRNVRCPGPVRQTCREIVVGVGAGPDKGSSQPITLGPANVAPAIHTGQAVRVQRVTGAPAGAERYGFVSVDRRSTLLWLTAIFALLVIVLARRRGVLALAGFGLSLLLVMRFVVPAISDGRPAFAVAVVGSLAVMFVTVGLTYGLRAPSLAAILGIAVSLLLAAVLGAVAVHAAGLDGRSSEFSIALAQLNGTISLQGVVLAGLTFGALGVLADMAVTQASAVMALRHANPAMTIRALYRGALGVGRDHLIATTHTLVLVYVGATLPLLLVVHAAGTNTTDALNVADLSEPIIATLVGAIALLVSVPLTTALAALLAAPIPAAVLPDAPHGHSH